MFLGSPLRKSNIKNTLHRRKLEFVLFLIFTIVV